MRRVGIKRSSSVDIGSWDPPPAKRPRVETSRRKGAAVWSRITSTFGGVLTAVRGWFHRSPTATPLPQMSESHTPSPPSSSSSSSPHSPTLPPSPPHPQSRSLLATTAESVNNPSKSHSSHVTTHTHHSSASTPHPPPSTRTHQLPSTHHALPSSSSQPAHRKPSILHEVQEHGRSYHHEGPNSTNTSRGSTHLTTSLYSAPPPSAPHTEYTPPTTLINRKMSAPSTVPTSAAVDSGRPESIGPRVRGRLFSPALHTSSSTPTGPHSILTRLQSTSVGPIPISVRPSNGSTLRTTSVLPIIPSLPQSPPPSPPPISLTKPSQYATAAHSSEVLQRRKWVESVKADHTHSLTQHREAVERELRRLAECRESRFRAEDSRVRQLQDSVKNMSLLSDFDLDLEEEEEEQDEKEEREEMNLCLSEEQAQKVQSAMSRGSGLEVLCQRFNISIKRADISTLTGLNWLNDEVINFYLNLIVERGQSSESVCRVHAMSSFFYPKLRNAGYSGVRRWTKKVDIFSLDLVLYPIHLGSHWCLAVVDNRHLTLSYYDSLGGRGLSCLAALRDYLVAEHRDKKKAELSLQGWTNIFAEGIPRQKNGSDCGVFTCMFARYLASNAPFTFSQEDMPDIRKHMICEILEQRLF